MNTDNYKKMAKSSRFVIRFIAVDIISVIIALVGGFYLVYNFTISNNIVSQLNYFLLITLFIKIFLFTIFGMYRGMWRYTSIADLMNILKASTLGSLCTITAFSIFPDFSDLPKSVLLIDYILCTIFLCASRASVRLYFSNVSNHSANIKFREIPSNRKKIIIIGAGTSSEKIIREIRNNPGLQYIVVGIVDDDRFKIGATIHGVPIIGSIDKLSNLDILFDEVVICISRATNEEMRRIVAICKSTGKPYRTVPTLSELIDGKVSMKSVREVSMVDLLGRKEIQLDRTSISDYISGRRVLVTGAGGSIGSELVRQCLTFDPDLLILLDQSEHNLFKIEKECSQTNHPVSFQPILGDIRDKTILERVFASFRPDVVFHAAAYKHVPMQEEHPWEAILTNIQGTLNLINVTEDYNVNRFVLVSTDKAVNPTNIMGATKRIAEKLIQSKSVDSSVKYMAVRFGNVIGSSGSVIPTFQEQIKNGGPVTITDPKMQRFFMSLSEASQLILQTGAMGTKGEIYVLDMGNPVNIKDIAYELIRLSGLEPEKDISIEYIGSRPGEENVITTGNEKIWMMKTETGDNWEKLNKKIRDLVDKSRKYNAPELLQILQQCVPEYTPDSRSINQEIRSKVFN